MTDIPKTILAGIDTGGTFTDIVIIDGDGLKQCKVLSTPDDPSRAICQGLGKMGVAGQGVTIVHGTTVGTNAVLEGKGARVAYVTSSGFADVLTLGRQNRVSVYNLEQPAMPPPVSEDLCFEVSTRILPDGSLLCCASDGELEGLAVSLGTQAPEAVAINLLFSFLAPEQEARIAGCLPDEYFVSMSSRVLPELKEYERGIATWLDASVGPVISRYLDNLAAQLPAARISVMQSSGTTIQADQAASNAVHLLLSGPAGGLAAANLIASLTGQGKLLTFDMGGTSTDVSLLDGEIPISRENSLGRWPLCVPSVDLHTIGAGGGSIARVDEAGMLLVGPESAGATPGPACYGQGGDDVTVTDANLVLGRIPSRTLLGGYLPLDAEAAERAMDRLAERLQTNRADAARGVIRLANEHMARALRVMSVERGHDPRDYALLSFGGAGGLHACELAELLEIPRILIPKAGGVLSALGMLASKPGRSRSRAVLREISAADDEWLESLFEEMEQISIAELNEEGQQPGELTFKRQLELRYRGQSSGIVIVFEPGHDHAAEFHREHEEFAGHRLANTIELVNLHSIVTGRPAMENLEPGARDSGEGDMVNSGDGLTPVLDREALSPGTVITGPAIVSEEAATTWVALDWICTVDDWGNLSLAREG